MTFGEFASVNDKIEPERVWLTRAIPISGGVFDRTGYHWGIRVTNIPLFKNTGG